MPILATDYQMVRDLVLREASIVIEPGREYLVESRLLSLARAEGGITLEQLFAQVRGGRDSKITRRVVEAMTTNETSFFRDASFYTALREQVLPELIRKRASEKKLTIWCAASSSGQEPFSVAMLLKELAPQLAGFRLSILATDYCERMIERCQSGIYSQLEVNRGLPTKLLLTNFDRVGSDFKVKDDLRRMVEFKTMNLATSHWPSIPPCDLVLIRNVLIYFSVETKREILNKVRRVMRSDGVLVLGSTETTFNIDPNFERFEVGSAIFHRIRPS